MRPSFSVAAQVELDQIGRALRRAYAPKPEPLPIPIGLVLSFVAFVIAVVWWLALPYTPPPVPAPDDPTHIHQIQVGDYLTVHLPDGRHIVATAQYSALKWEDLPWTGNHIGDARFVGDVTKIPAEGHWFVWMKRLGQTNSTPTWIDP